MVQTVSMFAVIFRSTRRVDNDDLYATWSALMEARVVVAHGYVSHVGFRDPVTREGVTISYFDSLDAISEWRANEEHQEAQGLGRSEFYEEYTVEVARIEHRYGWSRQVE